jgi:hypothetical protein
MAAETYIFNSDAEDEFYERLDDFHKRWVYHLLLSGVAPKGSDLESVKMTKSPQVTRKYCERVVGGLVNIKPEVVVKLVEDGLTRLECIFTKINDNEHINHLYMIQNVMDWPQVGNFSCQVWYLGETGINRVKDHWA